MKIHPKNKLDRLLADVQKDSDVIAVFLFGSRALGQQQPGSDMDVCLALFPGTYSARELFQKRLSYLKDHPLDIQIFQQLPLYIRKRVLKEGQILYCRNEDRLYELAFRHIREWADFEHIYREYLEETARAG